MRPGPADPPPSAPVNGTDTPPSIPVERIDRYRWRIPKSGAMRVEGRIYADRRIMAELLADHEGGQLALQQLANVASLPGIVGAALGMPDIHAGYGFPVGGVAAFDPELGGVVSPGGVGYDINCGVRLLRSTLEREEVEEHLVPLMNQIMRDVPAGTGRGHRRRTLTTDEVREVLRDGSRWTLAKGYADEDDLRRTESGGRLSGADPSEVSETAIARALDQLGTVGSGNHFIELNWVDQVYDPDTAAELGLTRNGVCVMIHSGSRGLGHQVCQDFLDLMPAAAARAGIELPDPQLACAPLDSPEAARYLAAMAGAANFAFANRQMMACLVREAFQRVLGRPWPDLGLALVYDVAHNNAKWENHDVDGRSRRILVHRKGATRAFPPGHPELVPELRAIGQPVLTPGDMGRYSFVLVGTEAGYRETFGSTCHGAGRRMSRTAAKRMVEGRSLRKEFRERGIEVRASSYATIAEEVPEAYKDVADVVEVVHQVGIGRKVVRLRPMGVLKG